MFKKTWKILKAVGNALVEGHPQYTDFPNPCPPPAHRLCSYPEDNVAGTCYKEGVVQHEGGFWYCPQHSAIITQQTERRARIAKWFRSWPSWQGHLGEGEGRGGQ
jgi:hypothetical protein